MATRNRAKVTAVPKLKKKVAPQLSSQRPRTRRNQRTIATNETTEQASDQEPSVSSGTVEAPTDNPSLISGAAASENTDNQPDQSVVNTTRSEEQLVTNETNEPAAVETTPTPDAGTGRQDSDTPRPPSRDDTPASEGNPPQSRDQSPASNDGDYQPPIKSKSKTSGKRPRESSGEGVAKRKRPSPSKEKKAPDRATMTMQELIYYNPTANPMASTVAEKEKRRGSTAPPSPEREPPGESEATNQTQDSSENNRLVPQLRIAADGSISIDESSMVMAVTQNNPVISAAAIVETAGDLESMKRGCRVARWSQQETSSFFKALSHVGTDFAMMTLLLPNRSRKELKNKFKREERHRPDLVAQALRNQLKVSKVSS